MSEEHINFRAFTNGVVYTFDNGYCVSVRWGPNNYAHTVAHQGPDKKKYFEHGSYLPTAAALSAEVAVWDSNHPQDFICLDEYEYLGDTVLPHCSIGMVLNIMNIVNSWPSVREKSQEAMDRLAKLDEELGL